MTSENGTGVDTPHLDVRAAMDIWRQEHPSATLTEIEAALDEHLMLLRQQLLQRAVAHSTQADWSKRVASERPVCPTCGEPLHPRGARSRQLHSIGGTLTITRSYGVCPVCQTGLFPPR